MLVYRNSRYNKIVKILYTLNSGQPGGMEHHVLDLVEEMTKRGHEVFVWCKDGPLAQQFTNAGAKVIIAEIKLECDPQYIFNLVKFLKKEKIDVLHAHEIKAVANSMLAGFLSGTKVRISHTHTPISEWKVPWYKKLLNLTTQFFVVWWFSNKEIALTQSRKLVKIKEWLFEWKLEVIPNGVRIEDFELNDDTKKNFRNEICARFNIPQNAFIFGNVGRISQEKGHAALIEAFTKFLEKFPQTHLLLAGGGPLEDQIREKIKSLNLENKVTVTGRFTSEDQKKYFGTPDCFVHPTLAEGFGIVALEAMASGLPLLVSDLDVLQEVCADTVIYFETGDSSDLLNKMEWVYKNPENLKILTTKAKQRVKELYSMQKFGDSYEQLYMSIINL